MTVKLTLFDAGTLDETTDSVAAHAPDGAAWAAKYDEGSNLRALLRGMAVPYNLLEQEIEYAAREFDANTATDSIGDWEASVGLPDECLGLQTDIAARRAAVIARLRKTPIVTLDEMQTYVNSILDGWTITLHPGKPYFSLPYHLPQHLISSVGKRFILVVEFQTSGLMLPYQLPAQFVAGLETSTIACVLARIVPANVFVQFEVR